MPITVPPHTHTLAQFQHPQVHTQCDQGSQKDDHIRKYETDHVNSRNIKPSQNDYRKVLKNSQVDWGEME